MAKPIDGDASDEILDFWAKELAASSELYNQQVGILEDTINGLRPMAVIPVPVRQIPVLNIQSYSNILRCWNK